MGLVKFIFITIMVLWLIRLLLRLIFPLVLKNMFSKMQQSAADPRQQQQQRQSRRSPEGSINIDYVPPQPKKGNADKLGDFVEYEEVK
jgi:hypothetical protein